MQNSTQQFQIRGNGFFGLIAVVLFFVVLFFLVKGLFKILTFAAPVLIIAALLINYRTVLGFLKYLWNLLLRKPLMGILAIILSILGFALVSGFLFGKSILDRRIRLYQTELKKRTEGELVDYEEISETEEGEILDLETLPPGKRNQNSYEQFFDDDNPKR
jgi:hypothetical protein